MEGICKNEQITNSKLQKKIFNNNPPSVAKLVEWYGSKDDVLEAGKNSKGSEVFTSYQKRMGNIQKKLADKKGTDVNSIEVKELVGEYDFVSSSCIR